MSSGEGDAHVEDAGSGSITSPPTVTSSLIDDRTARRNSVRITGHGNMYEPKEVDRPKVKKRSAAIRAEDHIELEHMAELEQIWETAGGGLRFPDFRQAFKVTIGHKLGEDFDDVVSFLFKKMDTNMDGEVDWDEFCTYMMVGLQEKDDVENERDNPLVYCPALFETRHRNSIVRIESVSNPTRFLTLGEDGLMCTWNGTLDCTDHFKLDPHIFAVSRSMRVTDAVYIPCGNRIAIATTGRDIRFYNAHNGVLLNIVDCPHIISCLSFVADSDNPDDAQMVAGDTDGHVLYFRFFEATIKLFNDPIAKRVNEDQRIHFKDCMKIPKSQIGGSRVDCKRFRIHREEGKNTFNQSCRRVRVLPALGGFLSASSTTQTALVFFDVAKGRQRNFVIQKGCLCFDVMPDSGMIASGGQDLVLRLWKDGNWHWKLRGHRSCA